MLLYSFVLSLLATTASDFILAFIITSLLVVYFFANRWLYPSILAPGIMGLAFFFCVLETGLELGPTYVGIVITIVAAILLIICWILKPQYWQVERVIDKAKISDLCFYVIKNDTRIKLFTEQVNLAWILIGTILISFTRDYRY